MESKLAGFPTKNKQLVWKYNIKRNIKKITATHSFLILTFGEKYLKS